MTRISHDSMKSMVKQLNHSNIPNIPIGLVRLASPRVMRRPKSFWAAKNKFRSSLRLLAPKKWKQLVLGLIEALNLMWRVTVVS